MDVLDELLYLPSLAHCPLTLIVRNPAPDAIPATLDRCWELLSQRASSDEVVLLLEREPLERPAACHGARTIRTVVRADSCDGPGLAWAIDHARCPVVVTVDASVGLSSNELKALLAGLNECDLVVGERGDWNGFDSGRGPLAWLARWVFGVPVNDPLSPIKAIRRAAAAGIALDSNGSFADFELIAKMTFLTSLLHDVRIQAPTPNQRIGKALWALRNELRRLFGSPRFWTFDALHPRWRGNLAEAPVLRPTYVVRPRRSQERIVGRSWIDKIRPSRNAIGRSP
jgi:hypothetical protein